MSTPSLFDQLVEPDLRWHAMLPNFSLACGADWLTTPFGAVRYVLGTRAHGSGQEADCAACLERHGGIDGLRAEIRAQQTRQAAA